MPAEPVDPFDEDRGQAIRDGGDRHAGRGYCETDVPEKSTHAVTRRGPPGPRPVLVRTALRSEEDREMVERGLVERADAVTRL